MKRTRSVITVSLAVAVLLAVSAVSFAADGEGRTGAKKHFSLAVQYKNSDNYDAAVEQYEKSLALDDGLYQVHYSYAAMLYDAGKLEEAKAHFRRALELNGEHYNSALMLAKIYHKESAYEQALEMYETMYAIDPEKPGVLASIAGIREYLEDREGALAAYGKLVGYGIDSYDIRMRAAKLSYKLGKPESARTHAAAALEQTPGDEQALRVAAQTSLDLGENDAAAEYFRTLHDTVPDDLAVIEQLERLYRNAADQENLLWALERHNELAPENVHVIGEISEILYARGEIERALEYVHAGLQIAPDDGRFRIMLGESYATSGKMDKALDQYRIALNDAEWSASAQQLIWQIEKPESAEEKSEREFFSRGK